MCAWVGATSAFRLEMIQVEECWRAAGAESTVLQSPGTETTIGVVPVTGGYWAAFAVRSDKVRTQVSVGLGCNPDLSRAVVTALREMLQVLVFLESERSQWQPDDSAEAGSERAKAQYMMSQEGLEHTLRFVESWVQLPSHISPIIEAALSAEPGGAQPRLATAHDELLDPKVVLDPERCVVLNLSPLLPAAIRHRGWQVVRIVAPHAFQFRANEELTMTWSSTRMSSFIGRMRPEELINSPPHPLP